MAGTEGMLGTAGAADQHCGLRQTELFRLREVRLEISLHTICCEASPRKESTAERRTQNAVVDWERERERDRRTMFLHVCEEGKLEEETACVSVSPS